MRELDLTLDGGATLHVYDTGEPGDTRLPIVWHHGTPNLGTPPGPLLGADVRWIGFDRPGYGGSTPAPGRDTATAAGHVRAVCDALTLDRIAVMGHSGGSSHALATAALLLDRVAAVAAVSGLAPFTAFAPEDWFDGMSDAGKAALGAAAQGRAAKEDFEANAVEGDPGFTDADWAALKGPWSWFMSVVEPALAQGPAALIDDDLAGVSPWGFEPASITVPVLLLHGEQDRIAPVAHARWLAQQIPGAQLITHPGDGHISVLDSGADDAVAWLIKEAS